MRGEALERLLTTLEVRLDAIAICEIGSSWRLRVDPVDTVICHFAVRGHGFLEYGDRRIPVSAGTIIIVPPWTAKSITGDGPVTDEIAAPDSCDSYEDGLLRFRAHRDTASFILGCASLDTTFGGVLGLFEALVEPLVTSLGRNGLFASAFDELLRELSEPRIGAGVVAECLMKQAIVFFLREQIAGEGETSLLDYLGDRRLIRAVAAMIRNPGHPHSMESLALQSGMSRSSFTKHFTEEYRVTPGEFLQNVRMRSAARLLVTSPMPIKCLASAVGYASRSQFSRAFKLAFGVDPSAYREEFRRVEANSIPFQERPPQASQIA